MEENTSTAVDLEQTSDGFMEGWDEEPVTAAADQPEAETEEQRQPEAEPPVDEMSAGGEESIRLEDGAQDPAQDQQRQGAPGETQRSGFGGERRSSEVNELSAKPEARDAELATTMDAPEEPVQQTPRVWNLRYMDDVRQVGESDMVALAQKGLDYDRIRTRYDESKPVMELFGSFAQQAGMTIPEYVAHIRTQAKQAQGLSEPEARREVALEDREAVVAAAEAQRQALANAQQSEAAARQREDARRMADIQRFQEKFPDVARDPKSIPQEVWEKVRSGVSLVESYQDYLLAQAETARAEAEQRAAASAQNQTNAVRTTGSMRSAGENLPSRDPFLEGWNS